LRDCEFLDSRIPKSQEDKEIMTDYDRLLGEILDRGPSSETLGLVLGELKKLGHTRKVIQECLRALQHHPDDLPLRLILAEAYFDEGLFSQAEAEIETVTTRMDRYASAYLLQAEIYRTQKRGDEAVRSLRTYLALRPQDAVALDILKEMEIPQGAPAPEAAPMQEEIAEPAPGIAVEPPEPEAALVQEEIAEPAPGIEAEPPAPEAAPVQDEIAEPAPGIEVEPPVPEAAPMQEEIAEPAPGMAEEPPEPEETEPLAVEKERPEFPFEEEVLSEIATPTLAEVYVNQGQLQEAISIYEKVIAQNPEDRASMTRVQELRTMLEAEAPLQELELPAIEAEPLLPEADLPPPEETTPKAKQKKQKTIAILESWLANIRKMSEDSVST
jgi:tetratricopeptide (TPR) repeat protein